MVNLASTLKRCLPMVIASCAFLSGVGAARAQDSVNVVALPPGGVVFTGEEKWRVVDIFNARLAENRGFKIIESEALKEFFEDHEIAPDSLLPRLGEIADAFSAKLVIAPVADALNDSGALKISLYDHEIGTIRKTVVLNCGCDVGAPETFPLERAFELLFDAPEIVLSANPRETQFLPPPAPLAAPKPVALPPADSTNADERKKLLPDNLEKKGGKWKRIAAGTLLIGGGIAYFATRGEASGEKLADPPPPPDR